MTKIKELSHRRVANGPFKMYIDYQIMYDESHIREDGSRSFYHRTTSPLVIATDGEINININDQYNTQVLEIETNQLPE